MFTTKRLATFATTAALMLAACSGEPTESIGLSDEAPAVVAEASVDSPVAPKKPVKKTPTVIIETTVAPVESSVPTEPPASAAPPATTEAPAPEPAPDVEVAEVIEQAEVVEEVSAPVEGNAIHAGMSLGEVLTVVREVHGSTTDVVAAYSRLGEIPADLPTPENAEILDVNVSSSHYQGTDTHHMFNEIEVATTMDIEGAMALYKDTLVGAGWTVDRAGSQTDSDGFDLHYLDIEAPDAPQVSTPLQIIVRDGDFEGTRVSILHRADKPFDNDLNRFAGWYDTMPAPEGGTIVEARVRTSYRDGVEFGLEFAADWYHEDVDGAGIRAMGVAALDAEGTYAVKADSNLDNQSVFLEGSDAYRSVMMRFSTSEGNEVYPLRSWIGFTVWGNL